MTRNCECIYIVLLVTAGLLFSSIAGAAETHVLRAKVVDINSRPLEASKLFLYDSQNVRRAADFISPLSDRAGNVQIVLPAGKYWVVARYKSDGKYGPLLPGDKHSGEPLEVDVSSGDAEVEFIVADLRELGQKKRAAAIDSLRVAGRVTDAQGVPVVQAVVYANRNKDFIELPDYISAWTGEDGKYELYVPSDATYYLGVSRQFPPQPKEGSVELFVLERGKIGIAIDINLTVQ